jgi:hypothetical protein
MLGIFSGFGVAVWLLVEKFWRGADIMTKHGPLMFFGMVLIMVGVMLLSIGLLGEMQVRHYHEPTQRAPYSVERVLQPHDRESTISE